VFNTSRVYLNACHGVNGRGQVCDCCQFFMTCEIRPALLVHKWMVKVIPIALFAWFWSDGNNKFQTRSHKQIGPIKKHKGFGHNCRCIGVVLSQCLACPRTEKLCRLFHNNKATETTRRQIANIRGAVNNLQCSEVVHLMSPYESTAGGTQCRAQNWKRTKNQLTVRLMR